MASVPFQVDPSCTRDGTNLVISEKKKKENKQREGGKKTNVG